MVMDTEWPEDLSDDEYEDPFISRLPGRMILCSLPEWELEFPDEVNE